MRLPIEQEYLDIATVASENAGALTDREAAVVDSVLYRVSKWGHRAAALSYRDRRVLDRLQDKLRNKIDRHRRENSAALSPEQTHRRCVELLERTGLIAHQRQREATQ